MPTYDYECNACGHQFELFQGINDPIKRKCPECSRLKLQRLFGIGAAVVFKGSGFYQTDYRSADYKKAAEADSKVDALVACVGGGSNALGLFYPYIDSDAKIYGVEAAGDGLDTEKHSAPLNKGKIGVLHGNRTYLLEDENGQIIETHSISAGLDYPGVGPEHALLKDLGRVNYKSATDKEALEAFHELCRVEGIIPALETSHAVAYAIKLAAQMKKGENIVINLSGRGDKDLNTVARIEGIEI